MVYSREHALQLAKFEVSSMVDSLCTSARKEFNWNASVDGLVDIMIGELSTLLQLHEFAALVPIRGALLLVTKRLARMLGVASLVTWRSSKVHLHTSSWWTT